MTNALSTVADVAQISGRSMTDIGAIFSSVAAKGKLDSQDLCSSLLRYPSTSAARGQAGV